MEVELLLIGFHLLFVSFLGVVTVLLIASSLIFYKLDKYEKFYYKNFRK